MSRRNEDIYCLCPCFHEDRKQQIMCDGIVGQVTINHFKSDKSKEEWKNNFCRDYTYKGCPIYQICEEEAALQK